MGLLDEASGIRKGEELPENKIKAYIQSKIDGIDDPITIQQFPSGHSNLTYLIIAGKRRMVLRCPPHGTKAASAHDMGREYKILSALQNVYPYCPKPLAYNEDKAILGSPFYLMECIQGIIIRKDIPEQLNMTAADTSRLFASIIKVQHELHSIDFENIGLANFGKPQGYVKRQVEGWSKRYRSARTPDVVDGEDVMNWLADTMPPDTDRPAIIHNDFKFDNVVLDTNNPFKVIGVLDWEMATIGDPLMDLGCSLGYWVEPGDSKELQNFRMGPTNVPGALSRKEMVKRYESLSGQKIANFDFYYCFGLFRLAVIAQQIYFRYFHGQTRDKRFKNFGLFVNTSINIAERLIENK